eukprot:TRINITY_DN1295_c0_g1_i10.p1 TRINITY_DN1295_c0_g1~~TRINITY_DN1295_c0_g1_i10.p1  ORF type:complete len:221 (+),score=49.43 TRINITY_DN1295_c0_g1_i10:76-663(+)
MCIRDRWDTCTQECILKDIKNKIFRHISMPTWSKKKYFKLAKGFFGKAKNCIRICAPKVEKSLQYAYRDRRVRPRLLRRQWVMSINAAVREHDFNYSRFVWALNHSNIFLNRKILAELAINEPYSFKAVVDEVKIQGRVDQKPQQNISFLDALAKSYIAYGPVKEPEKKEEKVPYFGIRFEDKRTPEELEKIRRT